METNKNTIKVYARCFEFLCLSFIFFVVAIPLLVWFFGDNMMDSTYGINLKSFSSAQRLLLLLSDYIASALFISGLVLCIKIARKFQQGRVFTSDITVLFTRLGKIAAVSGIYNMIWCVSFDVFLSQQPLSLTIFFTATNGLRYLFIFVFLSLFASLVSQAGELQQDQDLTV